MLADYHVHTPYCGHAQGKTIEYVESAIAKGIQEIGFSDHLGRYYLGTSQKKRYWDWGMDERDIARYFSELLDLRETFAGSISIRIGMEVDYIEGAEHLLEKIVSHYPFDFLLGSIHCLPQIGWRHVSQYVKIQPARAYKLYFEAVDAALQSGIFQSLAHIDFIWRYVDWPDAPQDVMTDYISHAVALAASVDTCVEINANAYLWSQINDDRGYDMFDILLDAVKKHKASVTIGSDSHTPELVGRSFLQMLSLLRKKGIDTAATFDLKHKKKIRLG